MSYGGIYKRPRFDEYSQQYQEPLSHPGYGPPAEFSASQGHPTGHMAGPMGVQMNGPMGPPMGPPVAGPGAGPMGPMMGVPSHAMPHVGPPPPESKAQRQGIPLGLGTSPDGSMPVVKLRGLPFDTEVEEINRFLDVETVDVVLMKRSGRFSGEAFVVLPGMAQVEYALGKHKHYMGKRYVEVLPASREDYYRAVTNWMADPDAVGSYPNSLPSSVPAMSRYGPTPRARAPPRAIPASTADPKRETADGKPGSLPVTGILRLRGLPFNASQQEVADWFNELTTLSKPVEASAVHLVLAYDGRPTGSAFVEFFGPADAELAMGRDKAMMGSRYVELFHSSTQEIEVAMGGGI